MREFAGPNDQMLSPRAAKMGAVAERVKKSGKRLFNNENDLSAKRLHCVGKAYGSLSAFAPVNAARARCLTGWLMPGGARTASRANG